MTDLVQAVSAPPASSPPPLFQLSCSRGFSLIEVVAAMAILAVLVMLSVPAYSKIQEKARQVVAMREIRDLEKTIFAQGIEKNGVFPTSWAQAGIAPPKDPWGNVYVLRAPFREDIGRLNQDFDLYSMGTDGLSAQSIEEAESLDDVIRAGDGGFVGLVETILP